MTLSLPLNNGILGPRMRSYVPTPKFFTTSGDPGRVIYQILDMRKFTFKISFKSVFIVDVRFEFQPTIHGLSTTPFVRALVRWPTGKRLTNRLPKLSLITLSPPLNSGILGLRMGPYVPTPKFFTTSGDPRRVIHQILDMRKYAFL